jgi:Cu2+-exporting ATPase
LLGDAGAGGEVYFDSVTMFVFFLLGGRLSRNDGAPEGGQRDRGAGQVAAGLCAKNAQFPGRPQHEQRVVADLRPGDFVLVRAGDIVPADGRVVEGVSCANEALLTGESRPVPKSPGEAVTGGSINAKARSVVRVEQVGEGTRLSAIIGLMERAAAEKPRIVEMADRIASHFVAAAAGGRRRAGRPRLVFHRSRRRCGSPCRFWW